MAMSRVVGLKAHRKQVITHVAIIVGSLLLVIFVVEPLFDRLEAIPGEAQLHRLELPAATNGMRSHVDHISTDGRTTVEMRGWAFIEGQDSEGSRTYIVLESADRTYVFDTHAQQRPDVTRHFGELGLNLDQSGFAVLVPVRKMTDGEYTIGIYIRKGEIEALRYTNRAITKSGGGLEVTG